MTNEQYLIFSYFAIGVFSVFVGLASYAWLRRPFSATVDQLSIGVLAGALKRLFPFGLVLPGLVAFLSVNYHGCEGRPYDAIVADRAYILMRNREQVSGTLEHVAYAALIWAAVLFVCFLSQRKPGLR